MDYGEMKDYELIQLRDQLKRIHTGITNKTIAVSDGNTEAEIKDKRLEDLLWHIYIETHNELTKRFPPLRTE